jgi:hypothetical protein
MANDIHPLIREQFLLDGGSQDAEVNLDEFVAHQQAKMFMATPQQRAATLAKVDEAIGDESYGTSLRSRADLFECDASYQSHTKRCPRRAVRWLSSLN